MKFSVVTATFNSDATLQHCLASVRNQDGVELEHIVIDGGSKDRTLDILKDSGVKYVSEPDKGVYDAFNKGLAMASGDVVSFLGSDDFYLAGALNAVECALSANPKTLCIHGNIMVGAREIRPPSGFQALGGARLLHPATFMRKELFERIGDFDIQFKIAADLDLFLRARSHCEFVHIDKPLTGFSLGGMSTVRLLETSSELRAILLKNGYGAFSANAHYACSAARAFASILKRKLGA